MHIKTYQEIIDNYEPSMRQAWNKLEKNTDLNEYVIGSGWENDGPYLIIINTIPDDKLTEIKNLLHGIISKFYLRNQAKLS